MLKSTPRNLRTLILLQITKELIQHSGGEMFELQAAIKEKQKETKERVKEIMNRSGKSSDFGLYDKRQVFKPVPIPASKPVRRSLTPLRIPEPRLPRKFDYLRPTPTTTEIDIEKLNVLVNDPMVSIIACNGPDENIVVRGSMGRKKTNIILNREEVNRVITKFSEEAKIPLEDGIFRVVVGKLILLATISSVVDPKFIIKKMKFARGLRR